MGNDVTGHTQTEKALREAERAAEASKAQYELIVSMISEIVWRYDVDSKGDPIDSFISPVADRMLGLPEGTIGNSFDKYFSYVHAEDSQVAHDIFFELLRTPGKENSAEYRLLRADGTSLWVRFKGSVCVQADGKVTFYGIISDITDRMQYESALAERDDRYHQLFEHMKRCVAIYKPVGDAQDFIFEDLNPAGERTEGVLKEDIVGRSVLEVFPGVKDFGLFEVFQRVWKTGTSEYFPENYYIDGRITGWRSSYVYRLQSGEIVAIYDDITEEKQAQEELRKTNSFLDSIIENIPDMIFIKDASDLRFVRFNRAGEDLLGYSRDELLGKNDYDFFIKEQADFFRAKDREVLAQRSQVDIPEELIRSRTKGTRVLHTKKISILDENGQPQYLLGISEDITERKRAEAALIDANQFNQQIIDQAGEGIVVYDMDLCYVKWNRFMEDLTGRPAEDVLGKRALDLFPHLSEQGVDGLLYRALKGETVTSPDTQFYGTDADHRGWVTGTYAPHRNAQGEIIGVVATILDITERKRVEAALSNSEERYRSVVENAAEGIIVAQDGILKYANPRALQMIEESPEAVIDQPFILFIHPDDKALVFDRYQRRIRGEDLLQNYDFRVVSKSGLVTWVQISAVRITWDGRPATLNFLTDATGRKVAEEALRNSEERYRAFFSTSRDCIFISSVEGRWIDFNDAAVQFFGFDSRADLMNARIKDLYANPDDRILHIQIINTKGYTEEYPVALRRKDGTIIDTLITSVTIRDRTGKIIGYQGTIRDVTEYKQSEQALRESKEQLMLAVEGSGVGLWDWQVQTGKVMLSERWAQIVGYTLEELSPISIEVWRRLVHPEDLQRSNDLLAMHFAGELPAYECEARMLHKDGHWVWILDRGKVLEWGRDGIPVRMTGTHLDITERKRAEEALREREALYRTVVSSASDGIILQESTGRILTWNTAAEKVFGIKSEEALGHTSAIQRCRTIREDGSEFPGAEHPSVRTLITGEPCRNVVMGVRNAITDQLYWVNINTNPLFKEGVSKPYAVVISFSDITERKKFEDELENRVNERTLELESQTAEMERFIYTVSHDLRSPLVTISGFMGILEEDMEKGDIGRVKTDLRMIEDSVKKMDRLLGETLELSRIGRVANPPEDIPMGEIVEEALSQTSEILRTRGIEVSVAPDLPVVHADRLRIAEVLVNLIENSVKYMGDEPNPYIDIGFRTEVSETVFFVRDNGMGIDPRQHEDVFGLFYKVNPKSAGTGAGLAIVKRIIEVHGGRIWIESDTDKGCTVCFALPLTNP